MLGNIFILGDSYSTFEGHIPQGYETYYFNEGPKYINKRPTRELYEQDVCRVEQTWWYDLVKEYGTLLMNCSWSGTTICNTGYEGRDCRENSFIGRLEKLISEGFFEENNVSTFFLFGGTNDSWANAPLGNPIFSDWTADDLYKVLPGFSYLLNLIVSTLGSEKIYCIINTGLNPEISEFYKSACAKSGVTVVELNDIDKIEGHPTIKGMAEIKKQVLECIEKKKRVIDNDKTIY